MINNWINKQINPDKTKMLLLGSFSVVALCSAIAPLLNLGSSVIIYFDCIRNLESTFNSSSLKSHINNVSKSSIYFLSNLCSLLLFGTVLKLLSLHLSLLVSSTATLCWFFFLWCSSARPKLRCFSPKLLQQIYSHIPPILREVYWIFIKFCTHFKIYLQDNKRLLSCIWIYPILLQIVFSQPTSLQLFAHGQKSLLSYLKLWNELLTKIRLSFFFKRSLKTQLSSFAFSL